MAFLKKLLRIVEPDDVINEVVSILKPFVDNVGEAFENAGQKELFHSLCCTKSIGITEFRGGDPSNPAIEIKTFYRELFCQPLPV